METPKINAIDEYIKKLEQTVAAQTILIIKLETNLLISKSKEEKPKE